MGRRPVGRTPCGTEEDLWRARRGQQARRRVDLLLHEKKRFVNSRCGNRKRGGPATREGTGNGQALYEEMHRSTLRKGK